MKLTKKQRERLIKEFGRIPTKEEVFAKLQASLEQMTAALAGAWETMPDDPSVRKQMVEAVSRAAALREGVYRKILKKKPPRRGLSWKARAETSGGSAH